MELNNCGIKWYFESKLMFLSIHLIGVSVNIHQQDDFLNLEHERDQKNYQEGSVHTTHTSGSHF